MNPSLLAALLSLTFTVSNPLPEARTAAPVVLAIPAGAGDVRSASVAGHPDIVCQLDDLNDDGIADELAMVVDLAPSEEKTLRVDLSQAPSGTAPEAKTHAYLRLNDKNKRHPFITAIAFPGDIDSKVTYGSIYGHGAVLEGLFSAIRVYMDNRQSVDLYLKHTPRMELDSTCFYTTRKQLEEGYGRDVLWAGTSVALGSFRGWQKDAPVTIDTVTTRGQRVVADGPVRSIIEVDNRGWTYNGRVMDMRQRYTTYAGHRDYDVEITLHGAPADAVYCTGVQKLATDNVGFITPEGLAGSWGTNLPDKGMPDVTDTIGLGIYVPADNLKSTLEDDLNYLTLLKAAPDGKIGYSFIAGGERDETSPRDADAWFDMLKKWQKEKENPVKVTVKTPVVKKKKRRR